MKDDRLERMMADPERYMAEARQRAREVIERDLERERERLRAARAEFRCGLRRRWLQP